jgi:glycosyltransferase involved in cell wall biosynthesis
VNVALVLFDIEYNSFQRGRVSGEEIDAMGMRDAFLQRGDVASCDIITPSIIVWAREKGVLPEYQLAIHFYVPTVQLPEARNVLFYQQFWEVHRHDFASYLREFDLVVTPSAGLAREIPGFFYLPLAADPNLFSPAPPDGNMDCQIVFVGNFYERDLATYDRYLRPALQHDLAIYGSYWDEPQVGDYTRAWRGVLPIERGPMAYASSDISLCIHRDDFRDRWELITSRVYHSLACSRAVISDEFPAIREAFPDGRGVVFTKGDAHLAGLLREYLRDERAREHLAQAGRGWVLEHHTWKTRVDELMALLEP